MESIRCRLYRKSKSEEENTWESDAGLSQILKDRTNL